MAGQALNDRMLSGWNIVTGKGLARSVGKATTEEKIRPKPKHLKGKSKVPLPPAWSTASSQISQKNFYTKTELLVVQNDNFDIKSVVPLPWGT